MSKLHIVIVLIVLIVLKVTVATVVTVVIDEHMMHKGSGILLCRLPRHSSGPAWVSLTNFFGFLEVS